MTDTVPYAKVTVIVEPLDGSPGYQLELPKTSNMKSDMRYTEPEAVEVGPGAWWHPQGEMVGIDISMDIHPDDDGKRGKVTAR